MLSLALPTGSLEAQVVRLFEEADLPIVRPSERDYNATIDDPRIGKVKFLRPPEIPGAIERGYFDVGLCETHSIADARARVVEAMDLGPGGRAGGTVHVVLAAPAAAGYRATADLPDDVRVATEFPNLTADHFAARGKSVDVIFSFGATEAKIPELADAIVEITESGSSLRRAGLVILDELVISSRKLIVNQAAWGDTHKRAAVEALMTLLGGVIQARGKVLLKMNVPAARLEGLIAVLPAMKTPTVSRLFESDYYALETVAVKSKVNLLIPELKKHGAEDILELPISKIVA